MVNNNYYPSTPNKYQRQNLNKTARESIEELGGIPPTAGAIFFQALHDYKKQFLGPSVRHLTQVMMLEYFIMLSEQYLKGGYRCFFHSNKLLSEDTSFSPNTLNKVIQLLVAHKVIYKHNRGRDVTYYSMNYQVLTARYQTYLDKEKMANDLRAAKRRKDRIDYFSVMNEIAKGLPLLQPVSI